MADDIELSVVLPAYEEAESLKQVLPTLKETAGKLSAAYEILVIDSREPLDATPQICAELGVIHVPCDGKDSFGNAVRTGIARSQGKWVVAMDADGSHNPRSLPQLWAERHDFDLVIGSRYVEGGRTDNPWILIAMSQFVNIVFRMVLNLECYDVSNSFRLYRGADIRGLHLVCNHFDIVEEILVKLPRLRSDFRIKEVPVTFEKRKAGVTKRRLFLFALGYLVTLYRLRRLQQSTPLPGAAN